MRVATVDIGTNSVNLLVADIDDGGQIVPLAQRSRVARLGQGVDEGGRLATEAISRVRAVLLDYIEIATGLGALPLYCTATSAARDASNQSEFVSELEALGHVQVAILSGEDEAWWAFRGAASADPQFSQATVLDIGGGSTELIGGGAHEVFFRKSLDLGSVRYTERYVPEHPPTPAHLAALRNAVREAMQGWGTNQLPARPLIGVAGTITSLAALHVGITQYDGGRVEGVTLPLSSIAAWRERLSLMPKDAIVALAPEILAGREDVLLAGATILEEVLLHFGLDELIVSDRGLRYGWALAVASGQAGR